MSPRSSDGHWAKGNAVDIEAAAAEWFGRQQFWTWTSEDQLKLNAWLEESLAHQVAYWRLFATWQRTERLRAVKLERPLRPLTSNGNSGLRPFRFAMGAAMVVLAAILTFGSQEFRSQDRVYATGLGESRTFLLADGSRIELNTNSLLRVNFDGGQRRAALERGEAYFQIRHDSGRPFTVIASGHRITDLGTKFLVRDDGPALRVTLFEGKARLDAQASGRSARSAVLTPGDVAVATAESLEVSRRAPQSIANSLAWRTGFIALGDHATLADAVVEFNRYNRIKLVIDDPSIARIPVAGRFPTNGVGRFADVVTHVFGLHVRTHQDAIFITR